MFSVSHLELLAIRTVLLGYDSRSFLTLETYESANAILTRSMFRHDLGIVRRGASCQSRYRAAEAVRGSAIGTAALI
jgi:hypothetical protein